jgi:4-amino-4-deoxy-L-arabinose transferase-like glycosyltransferase
MVHDWILSGQYLHPYEFALANYAQYPAFNIPYHPPAYPAALGLTFLVAGVSYEAARGFIAVAFVVICISYFLALRQSNTGTVAASFAALALATNPEMVRWARDTMSEIPSLAFLLAATLMFLLWLKNQEREGWLWASFGLATLAFFSRVTVIAAMPAWLIVGVARLGWRQVIRSRLLLLLLAYSAGVLTWILIVERFSSYEVNADGRAEGLHFANLDFFTTVAPQLMPAVSWLAAGAGLLIGAALARSSKTAQFWLPWLAGCIVFKLLVPTADQARYLLLAIPSLLALATLLFHERLPAWIRWGVAPAVFAAIIVANLGGVAEIPHGLVGYDALALRMSTLPKPGNILLACWDDQELMFRYRAHAPESTRHLLRADRTMAIRLADYANVEPQQLATTTPEVLEIVRRGRARYLVTIERDRGDKEITEEMARAARVARHSGAFQLLDQVRLVDGMSKDGSVAQALLWEYTGELPEGPSDLPIVIPTMGLTFEPPADSRKSRW